MLQAFAIACVGDSTRASHNDFYSNLITGCTTTSPVNGSENRVFYNLFVDQGWIPYNRPSDSWRSYCLTIGTDDNLSADCHHPQVFNNTFVNSQTAALKIAAGPMHASVKNNLFYGCGSRGNPFEPYVALSVWSGATTDTIQNNLIYSDRTAATVVCYQMPWQNNPYATPRTLAHFEGISYPYTYKDNSSRTFTAQNVVGGNIVADPKLNADYTISSSSPAYNAGIPVGLNSDFFGNPVSQTRPTIGAAEVTSDAVVPPVTQPATQPRSTTPSELHLEQNYPNPFNPTTTIRFSVPLTEYATLKVYNVLGDVVATLVQEVVHAGAHEVQCNAENLPSGVYLFRVQAGATTLTRRMVLLK